VIRYATRRTSAAQRAPTGPHIATAVVATATANESSRFDFGVRSRPVLEDSIVAPLRPTVEFVGWDFWSPRKGQPTKPVTQATSSIFRFSRCSQAHFSLFRLLTVMNTGQVVYKADKQSAGPFSLESIFPNGRISAVCLASGGWTCPGSYGRQLQIRRGGTVDVQIYPPSGDGSYS
jgi:hypothetical protein